MRCGGSCQKRLLMAVGRKCYGGAPTFPYPQGFLASPSTPHCVSYHHHQNSAMGVHAMVKAALSNIKSSNSTNPRYFAKVDRRFSRVAETVDASGDVTK